MAHGAAQLVGFDDPKRVHLGSGGRRSDHAGRKRSSFHQRTRCRLDGSDRVAISVFHLFRIFRSGEQYGRGFNSVDSHSAHPATHRLLPGLPE